MAAVGSACLFVGLLTAVYAVGASLYGASTGRRRWVDSVAARDVCARRAPGHGVRAARDRLPELGPLVPHRHRRAPPPTRRSSTRSPACGRPRRARCSCGRCCCRSSRRRVLRATRRTMRETAPYANAVLGGIARVLPRPDRVRREPVHHSRRAAGAGQRAQPAAAPPGDDDPPAVLYSGYVGFSIPFAFAVGALITRRTGADWIRATRRFALIAWTFLGIGILLGALWSYSELGWGGYWAWDPVENASLMPWLDRHRVPALGDGAGEARHAEGVERVADRGHVRALAARHVPGALGHPRLDPRVRRLDARHALPRLHRHGLRSARSCSARAPARRCAPRPSSTRCSRARRSSCSTTSCSSRSAS